jgi:hypothetical protein
MSGSTWAAVTWDAARVGGFVAYGLILASVVLGLALSLKWRSVRYPRFVTNEMHRFVTLIALVFIGIHGIAIAVDPFIRMSPLEVLIPFLSHYRPLWVAVGVIGAWLALAVYLSERVRGRIGYKNWRRLHYLTFVIYLLATLHGLGSGSDTRTPWAVALYAGGLIVVGGMLAMRIRPSGSGTGRRPLVAIPIAAVVIAAVAWSIQGPLASGWSLAAGGTAWKGSAGAPAAASVTSAAATPAPSPVTPIPLPFQVQLTGTVTETTGADAVAKVSTTFSGTASGRLEVTIPLAGGTSSAPLTLTVDPTGATCTGELTYATGDTFGGSCSLSDGRQLAILMRLAGDNAGNISGVMQVSGKTAP